MTIKSRVALVLLCGSPLVAGAVGLGDIRLNSALNQPFVADIDLLSVSGDELKQLHASLSSPDMFASHGVDRPSFLSSMTFKVTTDRYGHAVLQVRTSEVVTEPFVTLLIEVSWPQGRLVREYTVLLDPPVFADHPSAAARLQAPEIVSSSDAPVATVAAQPAVAARVTSEPKITAPKAREATPAKMPKEADPHATPRASAVPLSSNVVPLEPMTATGQVYEVARGDSLSSIGRRAAGIAQAQMNRWMVATFRSNLKAFDGNINRLRKNAVLTLPTAAEWRSIDAAVAAQQVHQQVSEWGTGAHSAPVAPTASAADVTRLRLVPSKESTTASQSVAPQAPLAGASAATAAAASTHEADKAADADAKARLADLQKEVADAKRQLELKTTELAELEHGAAPAVPAAAVPVVAAKPVIATPPEPTGPLAWFAAHAVWLLSALAALGVALWVVLSRRRAQADERFQETIAMPTPAAWGAAEPTGFGSIHSSMDSRKDLNDPGAARHRAAATGVTVTATDPLAEADFHIAYGLYGQAADLLKQALMREPKQRALQLKLLEVYYVAGNAEEFLTLAQALRDSAQDAGPGEWQNILLMGAKLLPEHPLFAQAAGVQRDQSLDFDLGETIATPVEAKPTARVRSAQPDPRSIEDSKLDDTQPRLPKLKEGVIPPSMAELGLDLDKLLAASSVNNDATAQFKIDDDARFKVRDLVDQAAEPARPSTETSAIDRSKARPTIDATAQTMAVETLNLDDLGLKPSGQEGLSAMTTKLELARAYLAMGDVGGARSLAEDVMKGGNAAEISAAQQLLKSLS